jgi:spore coat polysaccharide biosynthesis predicted glycosyltransferase SpsG
MDDDVSDFKNIFKEKKKKIILIDDKHEIGKF